MDDIGAFSRLGSPVFLCFVRDAIGYWSWSLHGKSETRRSRESFSAIESCRKDALRWLRGFGVADAGRISIYIVDRRSEQSRRGQSFRSPLSGRSSASM